MSSAVTAKATAGADVAAAQICARHLKQLGLTVESRDGSLTSTSDTGVPVVGNVDFSAPGLGELDEVTAQATYALMAVHGRSRGGPARLGVDYVTTVAGVAAAQGVLAAHLSAVRGRPVAQVSTSAGGAALLSVSQYVAAATAADDEHSETPSSTGFPPPFTSADGVRFEVETLDPDPWRQWWTAMGATPAAVSAGWRAFVMRYATGYAPLPEVLHHTVNALPFAVLTETAARAGVAVQRLRSHQERLNDPASANPHCPPWTFVPGGSAAPWPVVADLLPLAGLTVVEAGRRIQGPLAGHVLGLLGADVIRVEPAGGDPLRGMPPMVGDCSARFLALNRGKHVVEVDLRSPAGRRTVHDLVATADVFVHNWAPGKAAAMGLDSDDFTAVNPGLVYVYASGWGDARGPNPPPGTDFMVQAYAGLGDHLRPAGQPPAGSLMTLLDVLGGLIAAEGALAGLLARHRHGRGQRVDSSLLSAAGVLQAPFLEHGRAPRPDWGPLHAPIPVLDGHIAVAARTPEAGLLDAVGAASTDTAMAAFAAVDTDSALTLLRGRGITAVRICTDPARLATDPAAKALLQIDGCAFVRPPWRFTS